MPRTMNEAVTAASAVLGLTPSAPAFQVGQRVQFYMDGKQRVGTVEEINSLGYARVAVDLAWMHEWLPLTALTAACLPLATPVRLCNGVEGVISGHSTASANRYRISWYDRKYLTVRHRWSEREDFEVIATNETATAA